MSLRILSKELQLIAETELNEVPNRVNGDIQTLREWIKSQPHLTARTDDQWLLTFLRGSKFSLERAKEKIDRFYTARSLSSEFYGIRDPFSLGIQRCFDDGIVFALPIRECEPIRLVFRVGTVDTRIVSFETRVKVLTMIIDALLEEYDELTINGLSLLFDSDGITYDHLAQVTLPLMRKCALCFLESYPIRLEALHVINIVPIAKTLQQLTLQFVPKKLRTTVFLYDDNGGNDIYKHFPRDLLPPEYSGTCKPIEELTAQLKLKVESYKDWYAHDRTFCTDETKRPQESTDSQDLFGLDGSFRKLDID